MGGDVKDWMACKHFSLTDGGRVGLCDLVPADEWSLCYWDLDAEDLCPQPDDVPERSLRREMPG